MQPYTMQVSEISLPNALPKHLFPIDLTQSVKARGQMAEISNANK